MTGRVTAVEQGRILVTGASAGIGRELARQLARRARLLVLVARRRERLEALREELSTRYPRLGVRIEACDLADPVTVSELSERLLAELGGVDLLVNNAGLGDRSLFERSDWERMHRIIQVNVVAVTLLTHRFLPGMVERGLGGILNVGSGAGFNLMPGAAVYVGSKHYVNGFTETLRAETTGTGVTVTQVAPGPVETEFDDAAGIEGGLAGGADDFMKISVEQCAREAIEGFRRGKALVLPGTAYRLAMVASRAAPVGARRRMAVRAASRLREDARAV